LGRGLLCVPVSSSIAKRLNFHAMVENNNDEICNFAVSVDAKDGFTTGISAQERANTILKIVDEKSKADDFIRPGHIFPLLASDGGVLKRAGHTEATIDLCKLSNMKEVGVICEILNKDGTMARLPDLKKISKKTGIKIFTVEKLIKFQKK